MKNKFLLRKILIVFLLVFSLLGLLKPITVQAENAGAVVGGWLGNAIGDVKDMNNGNSGGPTYARTGFLVMLCDETSSRHDPFQIQ